MCTGLFLFDTPEPMGHIGLRMFAFLFVFLVSNGAPFLPLPLLQVFLGTSSGVPSSYIFRTSTLRYISTMDPRTVIPTMSNTIGAVVVGWGLSSMWVLMSRDCACHSHLAYATGCSACFVSRLGPTTTDTQMIADHISFWCVDTNQYCLGGGRWLILDHSAHRSFHYGTHFRPAFTGTPQL